MQESGSRFFSTSFQGLINKNQLFVFAIYVSHFEIQPQDRTKSSRSFYNFARQLTVIRDGIETGEQKSMFDLEVRNPIEPVSFDQCSHIF